MALTPGTRLGPYEVGVGGTWEVHRATDTRLKREVAVKVLPKSLAERNKGTDDVGNFRKVNVLRELAGL